MFRNAALPGCNNLVRVTHILYYTMIITKFIFSTLFQNIQPLIKHCNNITLIIIHILIFTIIHNIMLKHEIQISKFLETFSAVPVYIYTCVPCLIILGRKKITSMVQVNLLYILLLYTCITNYVLLFVSLVSYKFGAGDTIDYNRHFKFICDDLFYLYSNVY